MKKISTVILLFMTLGAIGQTAQDYLDLGIEKHEAQDYKEALKYYDKAIKSDKKLTSAYFNRGSVRFETKDLKGALEDFNKVISLNDKFTRAYYSRAAVFVSQEKYAEAIPDLNIVIEQNEQFPNALTLRGQLFAAVKDMEASCKDFQRAKDLGDPAADNYLSKFCKDKEFAAQGKESLNFEWEETDGWKIASNQENEQMIMIELLKNNETLENWTEIGTMQTLKGLTGVPLDEVMNLMYQQALTACSGAKLTFIEKDESASTPWILFTIECAAYEVDNTAESQLWYVVQGKTALFTNFRAIKKSKLSKDILTEWIPFFKSGEIVFIKNGE